MMKSDRPLVLAAALALLISACSTPRDIAAPTLDPQFGSPRDDYADVVTTDAQRGRVYVAGAYTGPFDEDGRATRGEVVYYRRYNRDGSLAWKVSANAEAFNTRVGTAGADTDASGNVYFARSESGQGLYSSFVSKYNPAGDFLLEVAVADRTASGLAVDGAGNIYVAGRVETGGSDSTFVRKYTGGGRLVWEKTLQDPHLSLVLGLDVSADGAVYAVGSAAEGGITTPRVVKLRGSDGELLWRKLTGGGYADDVEVRGSFVYVLSQTASSDPLPAFVCKFRANGLPVWQRPTGTVGEPGRGRFFRGLSTDPQGNAYLTGSFVGASGRGADDYFVRKYTPSSDLAFDKVFQEPATNAQAFDIGVVGSSELYLVGSTNGTVNGKNNGGRDAFLLRLDGQGRRVWER